MKWPWGELTGYPLLGPHAVRTANIHCVLRFEAFTILERRIYVLISAFGLRTPKSILLYIALLGSHALRTKNIHCVLYLTNKEASTLFCSVVKHAGSGRARKKCKKKEISRKKCTS